jgi:hypothetical protein
MWTSMLFLVWFSSALAQPAAAPEAASAAGPEVVWSIAETESRRFPDADTAGPKFAPSTRLEVLVRDPARLRVRSGDEYGWVPVAAVTSTAPEGMDEDAALEEFMRQLQLPQ